MSKYIGLPRGRFQITPPPSSLPLPPTKPTDTAGSAAPHGNPAAPAAFGLYRHWPGLRGRLGGGPCQPGGGLRQKENSCCSRGGGDGLDGSGDRGGLPAATAGERHRGVRRVREVPSGEEAEEEQEVGPFRSHRGPAGASRVGKGLLLLLLLFIQEGWGGFRTLIFGFEIGVCNPRLDGEGFEPSFFGFAPEGI